MEKEDILLQKRLKELARRSYEQNQFTFTTFLSPSELDLFLHMEKELSYASPTIFGGNDTTDRVMIRFGKEEELGYVEEFPIVCIKMEPLIEKFGEQLSHRDYLGSLMNLGIKRETIGDIFIKGKTAYLFCQEQIAEYIKEHLVKIKHTNIKCVIEEDIKEFIKAEQELELILTSSYRIDGVISKIYHLSRTQSIELFRKKKVFLNGRVQENNSYSLKDKDIISVRGYGKIQYLGLKSETKKGKFHLQIGRYV
ncbi:MAG: YlmH/Sll1252 family protein [Lachnospiraceae bacterium]